MSDNTQTYTNYASHNALTVTGRILNAEIPKGRDFLAVTVISTLSKDGQEVNFTFYNSEGLMKLHAKGFLNKGRQVTLTGHIESCRETYTKGEEVHMLKRPEIHLVQVQILDGGLGPAPKGTTTKSAPAGAKVITHKSAPVDATPNLEPAKAEAPLY